MARGKQNYHIVVHGNINQSISSFYANIIKQVLMSNNMSLQDVSKYVNRYIKIFKHS